MSENVQLVRMKGLTKMVSMSRSTIYAMMERGEFPKPIKRGRMIFWRQSDIIRWVSQDRFEEFI